MLPRWLYETLPWICLLIGVLGPPAAGYNPAALVSALVLCGAALWILWMRHAHRLRPRREGLSPRYRQLPD